MLTLGAYFIRFDIKDNNRLYFCDPTNHLRLSSIVLQKNKDPKRLLAEIKQYGSFIFRWPLDHIFVSEHFRVVAVERGEDIGSDHFPIFVNLSFEPDGAAEQKANPPTEKQLERAGKQTKNEQKEEE